MEEKEIIKYNKKGKGLNRATLKNIALIAMLLDHIGLMFLSGNPTLYIIFRTIGRITAPMMCFFIAQGYVHTSSKLKYGGTLLAFAFISQVFYINFAGIEPWQINLNVIFNLFLCFISLFIYQEVKENILKVIYLGLVLFISYYCDWGVYAILWTLCFYIFRKNRQKMLLSSTGVCLIYIAATIIEFLINSKTNPLGLGYFIIPFGTLFTIFLISMYNGEKGRNFLETKYSYYIFYPAHMYLLSLIKVIFGIS